MRTVGIRNLFDDKNAARVRFELDRNTVLQFVVQSAGETEKTEMAVQDYNEALTFAIKDIVDNWEKYRERYEQWLKQP